MTESQASFVDVTAVGWNRVFLEDSMGLDRMGDSQHYPTRLLVDGDTVYGVPPAHGAPNTLAAYDLTTGKQKWAKQVDDARVPQPVAVAYGSCQAA